MRWLIWSLGNVEEVLRRWQDNKFDGLIVIDGNRGLGKSTLGVKTALRFAPLSFNMKTDIVFSREDVIKHLATRKRGIIIADEMINVTYNRDFHVDEQKKLIKMLNMYRDKRNILIACVPNFYDLDKQFRALVKLRLNVVRRGLAIIHMKNQSSYSADKWDMKENEKIEKSWLKKTDFKPNWKRLTTYRGVLKFGDLGAKQRRRYESIKEEKRNNVFRHLEIEKMAKEAEQINVYDKMLERIKAGKLNKEGVRNICVINGMKYNSCVSNLNNRLKEEESEQTLSWYFNNQEKLKSISSMDNQMVVTKVI